MTQAQHPLAPKDSHPRQWAVALVPSPSMIEDGCRGMYGKHWDGPPDKMPGEKMKDVWRELARKCLEAALGATP